MICTARIGEGTLLKKRNRPFGWFRFFCIVVQHFRYRLLAAVPSGAYQAFCVAKPWRRRKGVHPRCAYYSQK